jgi:uncharacterized membrane protein YhhN
MTKKTTYLYFLLATLYCLLTLVKPYPFAWFVKILPMFVLLFTVSLQVIIKTTLPKLANNQTSSQNGKTVTMLLMALLCSTCGDILLAIENDSDRFFIFGLTSFLIAHLFFIASFKPLIKQNLAYIPIYLVIGVTLFSLMAENLNALFIPVLVYMLVLLTMAVGTLLSSRSNKWMIIGGVCFVISDSLIGLTKFYIEIPQSHLWIMVTYYFAQYCLVNGLIAASDE